MRKALPYSQFLRLRRICSNEEKLKEHNVTLKGHFTKRGYPEKILDEAMQLAMAKSRTSLLNPPEPISISNPEGDDINTFFAITEFHPTQHGFRECIEKNWDVLGSPATKKIFESKIIFGNRRPKNLREHLVRANFKPSISEADPSQVTLRLREKACASPGRCRYFKKLDTGGSIRGKSDGRTFQTRTQVTCRSDNLIYAIECTLHYIGQTKRRLMDRMVTHFASISGEQLKYPVGFHFSKKNKHNGLDNVKLFVLEFCQTPNRDEYKTVRETLERKWQFRLLNNYPRGMNLDDSTPNIRG